MKALDIKIICANTPQAKGRVERVFGGSAKKLLGKKREPGSIGRVYQEKTNEQEAQDGV
jgi:hypothetical protein